MLCKQLMISSKQKHSPPKPNHSNARFPKPYVLIQFAFKAYKDYKNETRSIRDTVSFTFLEIDIKHFATNVVRSAAIG
jgi:hypothetical protein